MRQYAKFVAARHRLALAEVALGHRARALDQEGKRCGQPLAQHERQRQRGEQREQQRQRQRQSIEPPQTLAREQQLLVIALPGLHGLGIGRELLRNPLQQLQHAHFLRQAHDIHRYQHAQIKTFVGYRLDRAVTLLHPELAQQRPAGKLGHQPGALGTGISDDFPALREQRRLLGSGLLAQHIE